MTNHQFLLNEDFIELFKLLKYLNLVGSGGEAKQAIAESLVKVNGILETRKAFKVRAGSTVEFEGHLIRVSGPSPA